MRRLSGHIGLSASAVEADIAGRVMVGGKGWKAASGLRAWLASQANTRERLPKQQRSCAFARVSPNLLLQVIVRIAPQRVGPFSGEMPACRIHKLPTAIVMSAKDEIEASLVGLH
jgi:hypothetical protein